MKFPLLHILCSIVLVFGGAVVSASQPAGSGGMSFWSIDERFIEVRIDDRIAPVHVLGMVTINEPDRDVIEIARNPRRYGFILLFEEDQTVLHVYPGQNMVEAISPASLRSGDNRVWELDNGPREAQNLEITRGIRPGDDALGERIIDFSFTWGNHDITASMKKTSEKKVLETGPSVVPPRLTEGGNQ